MLPLQAEEGPASGAPKQWAAANPGKPHPQVTKENCPAFRAPELPKQVRLLLSTFPGQPLRTQLLLLLPSLRKYLEALLKDDHCNSGLFLLTSCSSSRSDCLL